MQRPRAGPATISSSKESRAPIDVTHRAEGRRAVVSALTKETRSSPHTGGPCSCRSGSAKGACNEGKRREAETGEEFGRDRLPAKQRAGERPRARGGHLETDGL